MEVKSLLLRPNVTAEAFNLGLQVVDFATKTAHLAVLISQREVYVMEAFLGGLGGASFFVLVDIAVQFILITVFGLADAFNSLTFKVELIDLDFFD